jgi:hypothetical protein
LVGLLVGVLVRFERDENGLVTRSNVTRVAAIGGRVLAAAGVIANITVAR